MNILKKLLLKNLYCVVFTEYNIKIIEMVDIARSGKNGPVIRRPGNRIINNLDKLKKKLLECSKLILFLFLFFIYFFEHFFVLQIKY